MSNQQDLLFELGCEELPAKLLLPLAEKLLENITTDLSAAQINFGLAKWFATPRRLAILIHDVALQQPEQKFERRGPAVSAAHDANGNPSQALLGFLKSAGAKLEALEKDETPKGSWFVYRGIKPGKKTTELLPDIINNACKKLPIPKPMRWGSCKEVFIRPVRWVILLLGNEIVATTILGRQTDRITYGHRFHAPGPINISHPGEYEKLLKEKGKVIIDFHTRLNSIKEQASSLAKNLNAQVKIDEKLLEEVCGLVEWPVALLANFEKKFLNVPQEALIASMQEHQKCFPVLDLAGKLLPHFITISNIESTNPANVVQGNEKVMRARLSDAKFFYDTDLQHDLDYYLEKLKTVTFQKELGSLYDKSIRISNLAKFIVKEISSDSHGEDLSKQAGDAGQYCKADLATNIVGEFPELQGIAGYYYATAVISTNAGIQAKSNVVAEAIRDHYLPKFAGDKTPTHPVSCAVALADKLDTLVGIFGIGQKPTGEKDPFGLRRAALGIIRIILENHYEIDIIKIIFRAQEEFGYKSSATSAFDVEKILKEFIFERLRFYYREHNVRTDLFDAVLACQQNNLHDFNQRIIALEVFLKTPEAASLIAANKRVSNILAKQIIGRHASGALPTLHENLLTDEAEKVLWQTIKNITPIVQQTCQQKNYQAALNNLAALKEPVDQFFDNVMVMNDDEKIKNNRLALLQHLQNLFLQIADFPLLQG